MSDTAQIASTPAAPGKRARCWLLYVIGVPAFAVAYHAVWYRLFGEAVAIGDSAHPALSPLHGIALGLLSFPMMYLWFPVGEWLKPHLTDDGVISLFAKINSVVWGLLLTWTLSAILRRACRRHV